VAVTSAGTPPDGDGYSVKVDGGNPHATAGSGSIVIEDLDPGDHSVLLDGVAANCTTAGENPRTVVVIDGDTTETAFDVTCAATTGILTVSTTTSGLSLDPDGYLVSVDGGPNQPVEANGTITLPDLNPGEHVVDLSDVEPNCSVEVGTTPQTITVSPGQTAEIAFGLTCESLGNRIAFDSNRDGNYEIYIMNADGSGLRRLTNNHAGDGSPAISPDGTRIAFNSERDGNFEIYVMNADGSDQTRLTTEPGATDVSPTWSPDGSQIAFISDRTGILQIFIMNADGSDVFQRTTSFDDKRDPAWSPDGTQIAYVADVGVNPNAEIMVIPADGAGSAVNISQNPTSDGLPAWSPDGTRLSFYSAREGPLGDTEIFVMNADGSDQIQLTHNDDFEFDSAWSADGSQIAFSTDRDGSREIYVMSANGSGQTNLTNNDAFDELPDWGR
jgi:Tol biopolymer transport system component